MIDTVLSALLNGLVTGAAIVVASWLLLIGLGRHVNAATRYAVWWIVIIAVMVLPFLYFGTPAGSARLAAFASPRKTAAVLPSPAEGASKSPAAPARAYGTFAIPAGSWPLRLAYLWAIAMAVMSLRLVASYAVLHRRKRRAVPADRELSSLVASSLERWGARRRVHLVVADGISSPMLAGPFHPAILLPRTLLNDINEAGVRQICLHEAAHAARYDDWALLIQRVIESVFVLHPLLRWISKQIHLEREVACDDLVIALTGAAKEYAACLTRAAELAAGLAADPAAVAAINEQSHLTKRVELLLDSRRNIDSRVPGKRLAAIAAAVTALLPVAGMPPRLFALQAPQAYQASRPAAPVLTLRKAPVIIAQARPPVLAPPPPAPASEMIFVRVEVRDPGGRFVTGLDQSAFHVFADGVEQPIRQFHPEDRTARLAILWPRPDAAALDALLLLRAASLNLQVSVGNDRSAVPAVLVGGDRDMAAVVVIDPQPGDTNVAAGDVPVYTIRTTGGTTTVDELPRVVGRIAAGILNQYTLGYAATEAGNRFRSVEVRLSPPRGLPPLTATTRSALLLPAR